MACRLALTAILQYAALNRAIPSRPKFSMELNRASRRRVYASQDHDTRWFDSHHFVDGRRCQFGLHRTDAIPMGKHMHFSFCFLPARSEKCNETHDTEISKRHVMTNGI